MLISYLENQHLSAVIDVTRVNVFNISTQYKAVFTDDEIVTKPNDLKNCIFYSWLNKKVSIVRILYYVFSFYKLALFSNFIHFCRSMIF